MALAKLSTNPSRNLRDRGRRQHKTPKCCERRLKARPKSDHQRRWQEMSDQRQQRLQPRQESDREARWRETSDQWQQRLQARRDLDRQLMRGERSVTCLVVWFLAWPVAFAGGEKRVISDSKNYKPGENQTARQGEKRVIIDSKDYKSGENCIGRLEEGEYNCNVWTTRIVVAV